MKKPITKYKRIDVGPTQYPAWAKKLLVVSIIIAIVFGIIPRLNLDKHKKRIESYLIEILNENTIPYTPEKTSPNKTPSVPLDNTANDFWDNPQT